jgi:hypothetical protein
VRADLQGILHQGESVIYDADEPKGSRGNSVFGVEFALFLFCGSFFIIAIIATFVFGYAHGDSLKSISAKSLTPILWLIGIAILIAFAHKAIAKNLKLTSVIITEKRLFLAPPVDYVRNVGWEGPKEVGDIVFAEQLSVVKGEFGGSQCLIFTSLNPFFKTIASEILALQKRYIPLANVDEAFEYLPVFLKVEDLQFVEIAGETATARYDRAVDFLRKRKVKLTAN